MHDEAQHNEVLKGIRQKINAVLFPYNSLLEAIEIEPIGRYEGESSSGPIEEV